MAIATILARAWMVVVGLAFCDHAIVAGIAAPQGIAMLDAVVGPAGCAGVAVLA